MFLYLKQERTRFEIILVPRGRAPFGQYQESRPLGESSFWTMRRVIVSIFQLSRFVRLGPVHAQSDGKSVNRGLPVLDLPFVVVLGTDQKEQRLWEREWF